jgi:hypothetical protein
MVSAVVANVNNANTLIFRNIIDSLVFEIVEKDRLDSEMVFVFAFEDRRRTNS